MSAELKKKIEKAFTAYLKTYADSDFSGLTIAEGNTASEEDMPLLTVAAQRLAPFEDMPPETTIREIDLECEIQAHSEGEEKVSRAQLDAWLSCLENRLYSSSGALLATINKTTIPDDRTVTGVHVYESYPTGSESDPDGTLWRETVTATVVGSLEDGI